MNKHLYNDRGTALIVTLAIVAILFPAALQLSKLTGDSVIGARMEKDQFQAEQLALSGINLASLILVEDARKNNIDSIQETWADPEMLSNAVGELGLEDETLTIKITDELSKIQINALIKEFPGNEINPDQAQIWETFFWSRFSKDKTVDERDPAQIINSVKDWLDSLEDDAISGLSGAESDYYLGLDPPYTCANGPFNHVDEFYNVKGISKDILLNEDPDLAITEESDTKEYDPGDFFTVFGLDDEKSENGRYRFSGKVNINTAGVDVIAALLPQEMENLAQDLSDFRDQKGEQEDVFINPLDKGWYKKVINLSAKEQTQFDRVVRYSSDIFKVESAGRKNNAEVILSAFLKREKHKESGNWIARIIQIERKYQKER